MPTQQPPKGNPSPLRVIVVGAGTGGLCLAHGLKKAGFPVAVHERDRTRTDGLQGYRVGIDPDGSRALYECLPPDLYDTFFATRARTPKYFNMLTEGLREVLSLEERPNTDPVNSEKSISRMTLRQVLLTGLEEEVHFDKKFERYERNADGTVTTFFEDGTQATSDVLVGADGTNSRVRRQRLPHARLEDSGLIGITAKVALTDETRALLPPKVLEGVSLVFAPKGYSCILHVMEFKWDREGNLKEGIGGNDAELISRWPGLLYDNTRDYINWGFAASSRRLPVDIMEKRGAELVRLVQSITPGWHPNLRRLFELADPTTCFPLNIRTSIPVEAWPTTNVTVIGDAIHTMTPGRGVGANTALRDAALLCRNLIAARDRETTTIEAIRDYEEKMRDYGFDAVIESRKQMDGDGLIHKPVVGRAVLASMRSGMRLVNHLPPLKKRMAAAQQRNRGADRD